MALVSPGLQISVTDQTQYISTSVGSVPLVILATAQDKVANGSYASGTSKANAGALQVFGSQRELVAGLGYPVFQQSAAGTPLHGNELNEYGLMASYSSLGLGNRIYAIRADVDLNQLLPTTVRPQGKVNDGTYWFDLADSSWGIYEWNAVTQTFNNKLPIIITDDNDTYTTVGNTVVSYGDASLSNVISAEPTPLESIGQVGSYAVVATTANNRVFYKKYDNTWTLVGDIGWQEAWPIVTSVVFSGTNLDISSKTGTQIVNTSLTLNTESVTINPPDGLPGIAEAINLAGIAGVSAWVTADKRLAITATALATSNGSAVDGKLVIAGQLVSEELGITPGTYNSAKFQYGNSASIPSWQSNYSTRTSSGSVWIKTGTQGAGANFVFKRYNSLTDAWVTQSSPIYLNENAALAALSPAGGSSIGLGTVIVIEDPNVLGTVNPYSSTGSLGYAGYRPFVRTVSGAVKATGSVVTGTFNTGNKFTLAATQPGVATLISKTVTVSGTTVNDFVASILAANIPYVTAALNSNNSISITHLAGGTIYLSDITGQGTPLATAGFPAVAGAVANMRIVDDTRIISGFSDLVYTYSFTLPYANPADGTLWYNGDATAVDILINNGTAWKGYKNVNNDARGYDLSNTDPNGVIVTASSPTTQTDGSALVNGDLWLDSSDLENWPKLNRWNGVRWVAIDNTDQISQNGILFADARWDNSGTTDVVSANIITTTALQESDYLDLDAPDPALYPRGMLLFNTRRSGYNVKRYVNNYFNADTFTIEIWQDQNYDAGSKVVYGTTVYVALSQISLGDNPPNTNSDWAELETGSWVTASGNKNDGSMYSGHKAQRKIIVAAMQAAISANTQIREDQFNFNLIAAPGYPELCDEMVALNNDRSNTAFVIGDTPMTLSANAIELNNWANNTNGDGLSTRDPYLAVYYPSGLSSDVQGNEIMVPPSHMALRAYLYNDNVSYPWFAPAGTRRGLVDNASDIGYLSVVTGEFVRTGVSNSLRDTLYELNINPLTIIPGVGLVVWGQKTRNPTTSALDRVNVARLVNYIRIILASSCNAFLFEPNDKITRDQIKQVIEGAMNDLVSKRGIYDYLVVCDTSNNTPDRIARSELYVDIAISPMRDVEFIYIPIRLVNPGVISGLGK